MQYRYNVDIVSPKGKILKRYGANYLNVQCESECEKGFEKTTDVLKCIQENNLGIANIYYIDCFNVVEENGTPTLTLKSGADLSKVGKSCIKEAKALNLPYAIIYGRPVISSFVTELNTAYTKELTQKDKYLCVIKEPEGMLPRQAFVAHLNLYSTELLERINQPHAFQNLDSKLEENLTPLEKQHLELIQDGFPGGLKDPNVYLVPGMKLVGKDLGAIRVKTDDEVERDIGNIREKVQREFNNVPILNPLIEWVEVEVKIDGQKLMVKKDRNEIPVPTELPPELPKLKIPKASSQYPTPALFFGILFLFCAVPIYTYGYLMVTEGFVPGMLGYDTLTIISQFLQLDPVVTVFLAAALLTVVAAVCTIGSFCGGGSSVPEVSKTQDHGRKPIDYMPLCEAEKKNRQQHGQVFVPANDPEVDPGQETEWVEDPNLTKVIN